MHVLRETSPARHPLEAYPLGNGTLGALVFGNPGKEKILLNHENFWSGTPELFEQSDPPSVSRRKQALAECRKLLREGRFMEGTNLVEGELQGRYGESYLPFGEVEIDITPAGEHLSTVRTLDLRVSELRVEQVFSESTIHVTHFVSAPDRVYGIRIVSDIPFGGTLGISSPFSSEPQGLQGSRILDHGFLGIEGKAPDHVEPSYSASENPVVFQGGGMGFVIGASLRANGEVVRATRNTLAFSRCTECFILLTGETGFSGRGKPLESQWEIRSRVESILTKAGTRDYQSLVTRHREDYQKLYSAVHLELLADPKLSPALKLSIAPKLSTAPVEQNPPQSLSRRLEHFRSNPSSDPELIPLYFNYSRYLLISSSRKGGQPANLQGIWSWDIRPPWCSNWTLNINLPMNYWFASACGLNDCLEPLFDLIQDFSVSGQITAREYFGCSGWTCNHNSDIWGKTRPVQGSASWAFWPLGGVWMALLPWEHYLYTRDRDFLEQRVLPFLEGSIQFVLDWLQERGDGILQTLPSTSPENLFYSLESNQKNSTTKAVACGISSAMDLFLIRELFTAYLRGCSEIQTSEDKKLSRGLEEQVRSALVALERPGIDDQGCLLEWQNSYRETEPGHRHLSPLISLYPFSGLFSDDPDLWRAAVRLFEKRISSNFDVLGWSGAWASVLAARLGYRNRARDFLYGLIGKSSCNNLMNSHNRITKGSYDGMIFQIDGNFGGAAAILEMIIGDVNGVLVLLPALTDELHSGSLGGLAVRGGVRIDLEWKDFAVHTIRFICANPAWLVFSSPNQLRLDSASRGKLGIEPVPPIHSIQDRKEEGGEEESIEPGFWYSLSIPPNEPVHLFHSGKGESSAQPDIPR